MWNQRFFAAAAFLLCLPPIARADERSQLTEPPPPIYKDLAAQLTPVESVLDKTSTNGHANDDGIVLLNEAVTYVDGQGKRYSVYHFVDKAFNDAGVQSIAEEDYEFKKTYQKAWLIKAQTIQPDGTRNPVPDDAIFVKSPQDQSGDSIYDDEAKVVAVYPNVKPGSVSEFIILIEEPTPRIPGQFSQVYGWQSTWPHYESRFVVDLPAYLASHLKITNLGKDVPSPDISTPAPDRQRYTWTRINIPGRHYEATQAPSDQIGPVVWLSTLQDWDAFAAWLEKNTHNTTQVTPELKAKIDAWTRDCHDPASILRVLYGHVARDVRYTGIELGQSDVLPHDCMTIWQQQYGDCKDKSNLLRAMLADKGIDSSLVFLQTEHAGLINKANPDFHQFDHCILAVQMSGSTVYCDPTIDYGTPGVLAGSASDRDVLIFKGDHALWGHTPPFQDAVLSYNFDLKLNPAGDLSGWMEMKSTGYYSASYQEAVTGR